MRNNIKFMYNGIKIDGKLSKAHYSIGGYTRLPEKTITIYAKNYDIFPNELAKTFEIENGSDLMTDYFENDKIRVLPNHPRYEEVKEALKKSLEKKKTYFKKKGFDFSESMYHTEYELVCN